MYGHRSHLTSSLERGRFRTLLEKQFFFDGWWRECAPSYHAQTVGNLRRVVDERRFERREHRVREATRPLVHAWHAAEPATALK